MTHESLINHIKSEKFSFLEKGVKYVLQFESMEPLNNVKKEPRRNQKEYEFCWVNGVHRGFQHSHLKKLPKTSPTLDAVSIWYVNPYRGREATLKEYNFIIKGMTHESLTSNHQSNLYTRLSTIFFIIIELKNQNKQKWKGNQSIL